MTPTLIIGLGGFGSRAAANLYERFMAENPSAEDINKAVFLCIDTDKISIQELSSQIKQDWIVDLSSYCHVPNQSAIEQIHGLTDVHDWFDTDCLDQVRMIDRPASRMDARLMFLEASANGSLQVISESIHHLVRSDGSWNVHVHIISSLAGKTGSGIFLQTACFVKEVINGIGRTGLTLDGYFLLGEAFKHVVSPSYPTDYMLVNTYASLKELNVFNNSAANQTVVFEYRAGQPDTHIPTGFLFDSCYLLDSDSAYPFVYSNIEEYRNALCDLVYQSAFGELSDKVNLLKPLKVQNGGTDNFVSFRVSKLVYPVGDLFDYFACRYLSEALQETCCRIDEEFREELLSYRKDVREEIPHKKAEKGQFFMDKVEALAQNSGSIGAEFKEIYRSTQIYDEMQYLKGPKAQEYLDEVQEKVRLRVQDNEELKELAKECSRVPINFTTQDFLENDDHAVRRVEDSLNEFWYRALTFIDSTKRSVANDCFLKDYEAENYVSKNPEEDKHHLNTVTLQKDKEMHPLAVRYFLYDLKLNCITPLLNKKKAANERIRGQIDCYFTKDYNPETKDHKESAAEGLKQAKDKNKQVIKWLTGRNPYRDWKKQYVIDASAQAERIKTYITEKLLEETLIKLSDYVSLLLDEVESFFTAIRDMVTELNIMSDSLLHKHEHAGEGYCSFVLSSAQIKRDIFAFDVAKEHILSSDLSASLYRCMYRHTMNVLPDIPIARRNQPERMEEYWDILMKNLSNLKETMQEKNHRYVQKILTNALLEEARRESGDNPETIQGHMIRRFEKYHGCSLESRLRTLKQVIPINAWYLHPDCLQAISKREQELLFDSYSCPVIISERMSRREAVKIDTLHLLGLQEFRLIDKSGPYYLAYHAERKNAHGMNPHLDKHWLTTLPDIDA